MGLWISHHLFGCEGGGTGWSSGGHLEQVEGGGQDSGRLLLQFSWVGSPPGWKLSVVFYGAQGPGAWLCLTGAPQEAWTSSALHSFYSMETRAAREISLPFSPSRSQVTPLAKLLGWVEDGYSPPPWVGCLRKFPDLQSVHFSKRVPTQTLAMLHSPVLCNEVLGQVKLISQHKDKPHNKDLAG